jgi:hypothetical protein
MPPSHRFPPPWSIEQVPAYFFIRNHTGQKLGYFYYNEEPGRRSAARWRITANFVAYVGDATTPRSFEKTH